MKKIFLTVIFMLVVLTGCTDRIIDTGNIGDPILFGDYTEISGSKSGRLIKQNSPYKITSDLVIDSTEVLVIEAGVELFVIDSAKIIVYGELTALGTEQNRVVFSNYSNSWKGIHIINSPKLTVFQFCIIENVKVDEEDNSSALNIINSAVNVRRTIFRNNETTNGGGVYIDGGTLEFENNIIRDNNAGSFGGAMLIENSNAEIINNTIYNNNSDNFGGGFVILSPGYVEVQNNIFYENRNRTGNPTINCSDCDSTNYLQQYNFLSEDGSDPYFYSEDNLHLFVFSPCKDSGNPAIEFNDYDGTRNDMGAYGGPFGNW